MYSDSSILLICVFSLGSELRSVLVHHVLLLLEYTFHHGSYIKYMSLRVNILERYNLGLLFTEPSHNPALPEVESPSAVTSPTQSRRQALSRRPVCWGRWHVHLLWQVATPTLLSQTLPSPHWFRLVWVGRTKTVTSVSPGSRSHCDFRQSDGRLRVWIVARLMTTPILMILLDWKERLSLFLRGNWYFLRKNPYCYIYCVSVALIDLIVHWRYHSAICECNVSYL